MIIYRLTDSTAKRSQKTAKLSVATRWVAVALIAGMGLMNTAIQAAPNIVGTWSGSANSILVGKSTILPPISEGNFMDSTQIRPMLVEDPKPKVIKEDMRVVIADQEGDLVHGIVEIAGKSQHFVCTFMTQDEIVCSTDTAFVNVVLRSPTEFKVCFIERNKAGKSAGCSVMTKTK